jgi:hypothetical protein
MGWKEIEAPPPEVQPIDFYSTLCRNGDLGEAVRFLAQALPRYEAILWGNKALKVISGVSGEAALLKIVQDWIDEPEDKRRRVVWSAAEAVDEDQPERLLGYAVFLSGGSIAPEDQAPVNPAPHLCGQLASAAIITAAHAGGVPDANLEAALSLGEAIAEGRD